MLSWEDREYELDVRGQTLMVPITKLVLPGAKKKGTYHEHSTQVGRKLLAMWRDAQLAGGTIRKHGPEISDEEICITVQNTQLMRMDAAGIDFSLVYPRASAVDPGHGTQQDNIDWARVSNNTVARTIKAFPTRLVGGCQMPQIIDSQADLGPCIEELERCVKELGFVATLLNMDPSGGNNVNPVMTDTYWYPFYEKAAELGVPIMVHASKACCSDISTTGEIYVNSDSSATMQMVMNAEKLFKDIPKLHIIVPHAGGALLCQYGRFEGIGLMGGVQDPYGHLGENAFMDNIVYDTKSMQLLYDRVAAGEIPLEAFVQAAEAFGAVQVVDAKTGHFYDDTLYHMSQVKGITEEFVQALVQDNAKKVYPRLDDQLDKQAAGKQEYNFDY